MKLKLSIKSRLILLKQKIYHQNIHNTKKLDIVAFIYMIININALPQCRRRFPKLFHPETDTESPQRTKKEKQKYYQSSELPYFINGTSF